MIRPIILAAMCGAILKGASLFGAVIPVTDGNVLNGLSPRDDPRVRTSARRSDPGFQQ